MLKPYVKPSNARGILERKESESKRITTYGAGSLRVASCYQINHNKNSTVFIGSVARTPTKNLAAGSWRLVV